MSTVDGEILLEQLADAPWSTLTRVFGNSHATYIGLIVHWWIKQNVIRNTALESGPTFAYHARGTGSGGQCDAVLCTDGQALGVVEVEGTRISYTIQKIGSYFGTSSPYLQSLQFAILALYSYHPTGKGVQRTFIPIATEEERFAIQSLTTQYPNKSIIMIAITKEYKRQRGNIRQQSEYYLGNTVQISGVLFKHGVAVATRTYHPAKTEFSTDQ
jgi:hypothetical protein